MSPRVLLDIVLRTAVLIAIDVVFLRVVDLPGDDDGLGTGLLAFLTIFAVSGLWGLVDGLRHTYPRLALGWVAAGVLSAVAFILVADLADGGYTSSTLATDIRESTPFLAGLVILPALLGGGLTALIRWATTRQQTPVDSAH